MSQQKDIFNENPGTIKIAMLYGVLLGLFWLLKYSFEILYSFSEWNWIHSVLQPLLSIGSLYLIYMFISKYKWHNPELTRSTGKCISFAVLLCFFGSFFEAIIMYAHFTFINPSTYYTNIIQNLNDAMVSLHYPSNMIQMINSMLTYNKLLYIVPSTFLHNVICGLILGIIFSLYLKRKKNI